MQNTSNLPVKERNRQFVGIIFDCCRKYGRLYVNDDGTAFEGHCPRCYRKVRVPIAEDGVAATFLQG